MSSFWDSESIRGHLPPGEDIPPDISIDPQVMDGLPVIRGTRVPVYIILELLEAGLSIADILREYPWLSEEQVRAAIRFGSLIAACR